MNPNDLFNFKKTLTDLANHEWTDHPFAAIVGPAMSGKTRLLREFTNLLPYGQVITLDCARESSRTQIAQRASLCIQDVDALQTLRMHLAAGASQVVISGSSFQNSEVVIRTGSWWPFRRRYQRAIEGPSTPHEAVHLTSALLDDLDRGGADCWILIDQFEIAAMPVQGFLNDIGARLRRSGRLRVVIAQQSTANEPPALHVPAVGGWRPHIHEIGTLSPHALMSWANELGLAVHEEMANVLHAIAGGGLAGRTWQALMELQLRDGSWSERHSAI